MIVFVAQRVGGRCEPTNRQSEIHSGVAAETRFAGFARYSVDEG